MFTLDYRLDPTAATRAKEVDMASADSASLRYDLFPGDIVIQGEEADLSTSWGWVQVLDFALSLGSIERTLERERVARFEFTESNAALNFRLADGSVYISASYAPGMLRVRSSEFHDQLGRFVRRVTADLCEQHPRLSKNAEMMRYLVS